MIVNGQMCFSEAIDINNNFITNAVKGLNGKINDDCTKNTTKIITMPIVQQTSKQKSESNKIIRLPKRNKNGSAKKTHCNKKSGVSSEVYSFKSKEEIERVLDVFNEQINAAPTKLKQQQAVRNKLLFKLGINLGIRASDLRTLKWSFFFEFKNGDLVFKEYYALQPKKQRKQHKFVKLFFNNTVKESLLEYLSSCPFERFCDETLNEYIFPSQKPSRKKDKVEKRDIAISESTMWDIIKIAAKKAGITQNIGSHSLRKTWGFWVWHDATDKDKMLVILQHCFNHSSTQTTMRYIGLMDNEIKDAYESIELGNEGIEFYDEESVIRSDR